MVGRKRCGSDNSFSWREKKKLAPSSSRLFTSSATVCAIVDFPIPASPLIQNIGSTGASEDLTGEPDMSSTRVSETVGLSVVSEVDSVTASGVGGPIQHRIFSRRTVRVPSKQRSGAFGRTESYPAAPT